MSSQRPPARNSARPSPGRPGSASGRATAATAGTSPRTSATTDAAAQSIVAQGSRASSSTPGPGPGQGRPSARPPGAAQAGTSVLRRSTPAEARSVLPSRSPSVRPSAVPRGGGLHFRPTRPPPRRIQVKEDPDGPAEGSPTGSPAGSPGPMSNSHHARPRPPRPRGGPVMTASGPFARGTERTRTAIQGASTSGSGNAPRTSSGVAPAPSASTETRQPRVKVESTPHEHEDTHDADLPQEPPMSDNEEDGYEVIGMHQVSQYDSNAPRSLPQTSARPQRKSLKVKKEDPARRERDESASVDPDAGPDEGKTDDALDLDVSEDEEVMDDLMQYFVDLRDEHPNVQDPENKLYLFQFPPLFPRFGKDEIDISSESNRMDLDGDADKRVKPRRSVAFADDTAGGGGAAGESPRATPGPGSALKDESGGSPSQPKKRRSSASSTDSRLDLSSTEDSPRKSSRSATGTSSRTHEGQIGRLDIARDGTIAFRFGTDMHLVMDLTGGSQAKFLQHAMVIDERGKRATTLGEIHQKFVVAPEIASMLADALDDAHAVEDDPEEMEQLPRM